jgi:hypothetical protein
MVGLLYLLFALLTLALLIWALQLWRSAPTRAALLGSIIAAGLLYENLVLALGGIMAVGSLLLGLNWARYLLETLVAPLFIPTFADLARRGGATRLGARPARRLVVATILGLMFYGLVGLVDLTLVPVVNGGAARYVPVGGEVPVIGVAITLAALAFGALIWRQRGWPWLALVGIVVFVASGATAAVARDAICLVTNGTEILMMAATLGCERYMRAGPTPPPRRRLEHGGVWNTKDAN